MKTSVGNLVFCETGILVHGVNCQSKMGSGIAFQFRNKYEKVYTDYISFINSSTESPLGKIIIVPINKNLFIVNAFTQLYYGKKPDVRYVSYDAVDECFNLIAKNYKETFGTNAELPIRFPLIGCGLGNGKWDIIKEIILSNLKDVVPLDKIELWKPKE